MNESIRFFLCGTVPTIIIYFFAQTETYQMLEVWESHFGHNGGHLKALGIRQRSELAEGGRAYHWKSIYGSGLERREMEGGHGVLIE